MGSIVGAALVSHHPGLMQCEEFRVLMGAGADSDLIAGYGRVRERIAAERPDAIMIFDSHWFTTGYHLVDAGRHLRSLRFRLQYLPMRGRRPGRDAAGRQPAAAKRAGLARALIR